jgi:DNA-directed RNA polymerase specialized sigma24 family protein
MLPDSVAFNTFDNLAMPEEASEFLPTAGGLFRTTHWSAIVRAGHGDSAEWAAALNELCQVYWRPLYAYARHQGYAAHETEDLTQAFFAWLLEKNLVAQAAPEKGRFRSFLLTLFKRFLANEWHHQHTQKRGGFQPIMSIDTEIAESCLGSAPSHLEPPDVLFERQWAMTLLDQVMGRLQREYVESGRSSLYDRLEACLVRDEAALRYADIGSELGLSEGAVKMAMQRLRARYQTILREEIAKTVASPEEVEDEIRNLFAAFRR